MNPVFRGSVEKGRLKLDYPEKYLVLLSKFEGQRVELVIRKRATKRSDAQNKFYWSVIVEILSEYCGYSKDEMHDALKYKFLSSHEADERGLMKIGSTAKLNTDEFIRYTNEVVRWAAEMGVYIPDPSQVDYD